jgi:hypothetical protein
VFSVGQDKEAVVSFGAKQKFTEVRGGVGGVLEWELLQFCARKDITMLDHGRGTNPAGLVASAGVFEFKARYGNSAFPEGLWVTSYIRNPKLGISDLVFVSIINNQVGYTIVSDDTDPMFYKKYLTHLVNTVQVLSLKEVVSTARAALA